MNKSIIFVLNNFNIGGPQKSLLSLLYNFPETFNVDLLVLNNEDTLKEYLPKNVNLLTADKQFSLLMLNKRNILKSIIENYSINSNLSTNALYFLFKNSVKSNLVKEKQKFWVDNKKNVKQEYTKEYDFAIGVSGGHSIMYIVDFIKAKKKVGWVRTEYQNLNRNIEIDNGYFNHLDLVLSVSNKCTEKFTEVFPSQAKKVRTFYNPLPFKMYNRLFEKNIEHQRKQQNGHKINIATISRLDKDKGFDMAVEAAKLLKINNYHYMWEIYGEGPEKNNIQKQIKKHNLESNVVLKGFKFNTGEILKNTDILVHPSRYEGKSNTIDEAKYYEVPIVATNYPTVTEQLSNNFDSIITEMDSYSLYQGISSLILDKTLRKEVSKNLKQNKTKRIKVYEEFMGLLGTRIEND